MRLDPSLWIDLPGAAQGRDCWQLVAEVFRRRGIDLVGFAADRYDDWQETSAAEPGDVLLTVKDDRAHVGIYLGDDEYLHAVDGARVLVGRVRALVRAGRPVRFLRHAGAKAVTVAAAGAPPGSVRVVYVHDPVGRADERQTWFREAGTLGALAPPGANVVMTEAGPRRIAEVADRPAGSVAVYARAPEGTEFLIGLAITLVSTLLTIALTPKPVEARQDESSPTFNLEGIRNTATSGVVQPVVYGAHRAAGNFISAIQRVDADGRAVFYGLVFLSRGPVQSVGTLTADADDLTGPDIPDAIKIDGNPASGYDARVSVRLGSSEQTTVPGFSETATTVSYGSVIDQPSPPANWGNAQPFGHTTTQNVTGFDVLLTYPGGLIGYSTSSNAPYPITMTYEVRWRVVGAATWTTATWTHAGQKNAQTNYQFTRRGLTRDKYEVQVKFLSAVTPAGNALGNPDTIFGAEVLAVNEIVAEGFSYPGCALLGVQLVGSDQLGGGIPTITAEVEGRKVWIWDGVSTTSPAFAQAYTRNPAWIVLDILTSKDYGLGRGGRITLDAINLDEFLDFADWCDESVDDGRGGTIPRAYCDHVADVEANGWDLAREIVESAFGRLYYANGRVRIWIDRAASPVFLFTAGNTRDVSISYLGRRSRPNAAEIQFLNAETDYEQDYATKLDDAAVLTSGAAIVKQSVGGTGITRAAQAYRLAQRIVNATRLVGRRFSWISGPEAVHLQPGDVVYIHGSALGSGMGGRVLSATSSTVKLDRTLTTSARARIVVGNQADGLETAYVAAGTYARNTAISIVDSGGSPATWTTTPTAGAKWVVPSVSSSSVAPVAVRLERIASNADLDVTCEGSEYVAAVYDDDPGDVEEFTDQLPDPRAIPDAATNLRVTDAALVSSDGTVSDALRVAFDMPSAWDTAEVWYRTPGGPDESWAFHGWSRGDALIPVAAGSWQVAVAGRSPRGTRARIASSPRATCYVRGRRAAPESPTAVCADVTASGMLTVNVTGPAGGRYDVRYGDGWAGSVLVARGVPADWSGPCPFVGTETVRVRTVSATDVESDDEATASATWTPAPSVFEADLSDEAAPSWPGDLDDTTTTSSQLALDGSALTGAYASDLAPVANTTDPQQVVVTAVGKLADVAMTWDEAGMVWGGVLASDLTWATAYLSGREVTELDAPTWAQAGWTWDGLQSSLRTWAGPTDVVAALTPSMETTEDEVDYREYCGPYVVASCTDIAGRVTLRRPHSRYDPRLTSFAVSTFDLSGPSLGTYLTRSVPIYHDANAINLTAHPSTARFLGNTNRHIHRAMLTDWTEARLVARVTTGSASANNPRLVFRYHTSFSTASSDYVDAGTSEIAASVASTGMIASSWVPLASGAKADVYISVQEIGGDSSATPVVGNIYIELRRAV